MTYESLSLSNAPSLHIGVVKQNPSTGIWMYTIHITRESCTSHGTTLHIRHEYEVERRFSEFKKIYQQISAIIKDIPKLPESGLISYFKSDSLDLLQERKTTLEEIIQRAAKHPVAGRTPEFREFLGYSFSRSKMMGSSYRSMGRSESSQAPPKERDANICRDDRCKSFMESFIESKFSKFGII